MQNPPRLRSLKPTWDGGERTVMIVQTITVACAEGVRAIRRYIPPFWSLGPSMEI